ncbi:hypothetical protein DAEQUDRAFT_736636 [Daedalea quercina L-15889]|uniref:Uncharacterized protein n=1 Tax=Daedalea quercina L-15889 TaxID=1314783 RepID=A0A165SDN5_9APHY|nr:hypothetical protein DAEQUDRAFT_736636 [Daedalea quercina L-15889]
MLIYPYLLKGVAALKAVFVLTAGAPASWHSQDTDIPRRPTIGSGVLAATLAFAIAGYQLCYRLVTPDEPLLLDPPPPYKPLLLDPPPIADAVWQSVDLPSDINSVVNSSAVVGLNPPLMVLVDVPILDWSIPGAPTVRSPKVQKAESDIIAIDFYFSTVTLAPANSTYWQEKPSSPSHRRTMPCLYVDTKLRC